MAVLCQLWQKERHERPTMSDDGENGPTDQSDECLDDPTFCVSQRYIDGRGVMIKTGQR